jgi:oligopeptide/dipeptide ABC transporter ATP-binding protein
MDCATRSILMSTEVTTPPLLDVRELGVTFTTAGGEVQAVSDFSLSVQAGECVGVVGESGAGKSQALLAVVGLLAPNARVRGSAKLNGIELLGRSSHELDAIRGAGISMVFQDPLTSLTPHLTIGDQIAEPLVSHSGASWSEGRRRALELLEQVHVTDPARRLRQYPHELSGGMRQRVMIAMALACGPKLIIADEPTTALDVTIQAQILALLAELKRERGMAMVLVTHDLGVVAGIADRVVVMRGGHVVETGPVARILKRPENPYTQSLLDAGAAGRRPRGGGTAYTAAPAEVSVSVGTANSAAPARASSNVGAAQSAAHPPAPLLELSALQVHFPTHGSLFRKGPTLRAVEDVNLTVHPGEAVGIVGESGSGKSTLARAALQLVRATGGRVVWLGNPIDARPARDMQLVFQDPLASLDPRMTVLEIVAEPLQIHRRDLDPKARKSAVSEMLLRVGLGRNLLTRYPHELSGGQAQRVGIARAMILQPKLLVCDEAVSALDVSVQGQIVALLQDLKRETGTAILFISHNLEVVRQLCDRVLVLYLGRMMEQGVTEALYATPAHPYTRALLDAVPIPDPDLQPARLTAGTLGGELPSPLAPPTGCVFHTRCPYVQPVCCEQLPTPEPAGSHREVACHRWRELAPRAKSVETSVPPPAPT